MGLIESVEDTEAISALLKELKRIADALEDLAENGIYIYNRT